MLTLRKQMMTQCSRHMRTQSGSFTLGTCNSSHSEDRFLDTWSETLGHQRCLHAAYLLCLTPRAFRTQASLTHLKAPLWLVSTLGHSEATCTEPICSRRATPEPPSSGPLQYIHTAKGPESGPGQLHSHYCRCSICGHLHPG